MAGNRFVDQDKSNTGKRNVTSVTRSQRSTCNVVVYRWNDHDIVKMNFIQAKGEKGYVGQGQGSKSGNLRDQDRVVIDNDVVKANVSKNKSSNSGSFSFTLKRGKVQRRGKTLKENIDYLDVIHPGDWVMIYMKKSGQIDINRTDQFSGLKCLGIIEDVRVTEVDDPATGIPRLEYTVTGKDFGSVFDASIFFNPVLNQEAPQLLLGAKFLTDAVKTVKGSERKNTANQGKAFTPDLIVRKMIGFYLGKGRGEDLDDLNVTNQTWYIPSSLASIFGAPQKSKQKGPSFVDILDTGKIGLHQYNRKGQLQDVKKLLGGTIIKALPSSGTVWQAMSTMQNSIANEMYTELTPDDNGNLKPSVILRQIPFSNPPGETNVFSTAKQYESQNTNESQKTYLVNLPQHQIVSSDIKSKSIGKSEHERINHVIAIPKLDSDAINQAYQAVINTASIQRYGLKSYQGQTQYIFDDRLGNPVKACTFFTHLLVDWFFMSHLLCNGNIMIDGTDEHIQIGNNLYIKDIGQLFHIEGYNHTFVNDPNGVTEFSTELAVSRGQAIQNNRPRFIGPSDFDLEQVSISTNILEDIR